MPSATTALQVAVAAAVFLTGFLTVRLHGHLDSAEDRAAQAIRRLDELHRDGRVITAEDATISGRNYMLALQPDSVAKWANALGAGILIAALTSIAIAIASADWVFTLNPTEVESDFWVLMAMGLISAGVFAFQLFDVRWVRRSLKQASRGSLLTLVTEADKLMAKGDIPGAIERYQKILKRWPSYLGPLNNHALCLSQLGLHDQAFAQLTAALARWPDPDVSPTILINRAACFVEMGRYSKALGDCRKAIALSPRDAMAWSARAHLYHKVRVPLKALPDYNQGVRLDNQNWHLRVGRAKCLMSLDADDALSLAKADLDSAIQINPKEFEHLSCGVVCWQRWDGMTMPWPTLQLAFNVTIPPRYATSPVAAYTLYDRRTKTLSETLIGPLS